MDLLDEHFTTRRHRLKEAYDLTAGEAVAVDMLIRIALDRPITDSDFWPYDTIKLARAVQAALAHRGG